MNECKASLVFFNQAVLEQTAFVEKLTLLTLVGF